MINMSIIPKLHSDLLLVKKKITKNPSRNREIKYEEDDKESQKCRL